MVRVYKILVYRVMITALLLCVVLNVFPFPEKNDQKVALLELKTSDTKLVIDGSVREELFYLSNVGTLDSSYHDTYHFFRNKASLGFYAEHGAATYGQPAAQACIRLTAFNKWDDSLGYTPLSKEKSIFNAYDPTKALVVADEHTHTGAVSYLYPEEAWFNIDFDAFSTILERPVELKMGYFFYKLGRGISLGDCSDGSVEFLGWQTSAPDAGNNIQAPPGILFLMDFSDAVTFECYYSKWRSFSSSASNVREPVNYRRLEVREEDKDVRAMQRGTKADREFFSVKADIDIHKKAGSYNIEPYCFYVHDPEECIEVKGDASLYLGTVGMKGEYVSSRFRWNAECAFQYGTQYVHAIDRNEYELETTPLQTQHSNLFLMSTAGITKPEDVYLLLENVAYDDTIHQEVNTSYNRYKGANGKQLVNSSGAPLTVTQVGKTYGVYNGDLPFGGYARFRDNYKVTMQGFMAVADALLVLKPLPLCLAVCGGYINGDSYPYNTEVDKVYKGFIPLRDRNYVGEYVRSFALLYSRKIPRPVDFAHHKAYAYNHDESMSNLAYIGMGLQWMPTGNPKQALIAPSFFAFWQPAPPCKWDNDAVHDWNNPVVTSYYAAAQKTLGYQGAPSEKKASSFLGWEASIAVMWNIVPSLELGLVGALFVPGPLYEDVHGMPNRNTRFVMPDGSFRYKGLGTDPVIGGSIRLTYRF